MISRSVSPTRGTRWPEGASSERTRPRPRPWARRVRSRRPARGPARNASVGTAPRPEHERDGVAARPAGREARMRHVRGRENTSQATEVERAVRPGPARACARRPPWNTRGTAERAPHTPAQRHTPRSARGVRRRRLRRSTRTTARRAHLRGLTTGQLGRTGAPRGAVVGRVRDDLDHSRTQVSRCSAITSGSRVRALGERRPAPTLRCLTLEETGRRIGGDARLELLGQQQVDHGLGTLGVLRVRSTPRTDLPEARVEQPRWSAPRRPRGRWRRGGRVGQHDRPVAPLR